MRICLYTLFVVTIVDELCCTRAQTLCDVRSWYLKIITDDVFDRDLTHEQLSLKYEIESLVLKTSENKGTRMTDCSMLKTYNDRLRDIFSYTTTSVKHSTTETEAAQTLQSRNEESNEIVEQNVYGKGEHDETELEESHITNMDQEDHTNTRGIDQDEDYSSDIEIAAAEEDVELEREYTKKEEIKENEKIDRTTDKDLVARSRTELSDTESAGSEFWDIDQPLENNDDTKIPESSDIAFTESTYVSMDTPENEIDKKKDISDVFVPRSIPFGMCRPFGCLVSDIFDVFGNENDFVSNGHNYEQDSESLSTRSNKHDTTAKYEPKCPLRKCTLQCFYVFLLSRSYFLTDIVYSITFKINKKKEKNLQNQVLNDEENAESVLDSKESFEDFDIANNENILEDIHIPTKLSELSAEEINEMNKGQHNTLASPEVELKQKSALNSNSEQNVWTATRFEYFVEQMTAKYNSQLQTLELMIIKLENKLLIEAIDKHNHSSTISKLENHILKLENEILKMNKNYQHIREESIKLSNRQNKYLKLAYSYKSRQKNEYPELPNYSNAKYELISQHQAKINELTEVLENQSSIIKQLKNKHDNLEENNQLLQEMILNQTYQINSILKNMQDMEIQNANNQQEMHILKQTLHKRSEKEKLIGNINYETKQNVIDKLDSMLFDTQVQKLPFEESIGEENANLNPNENLVEKATNVNVKAYPDRETKFTTISDWCPIDNKGCPSCYYSSFIYSRCIPFRKIIWSDCETEHKSTGIEFPSIPLPKADQIHIIDEINSIEFTHSDNVETNSQERQKYGNSEHLNDIQTKTFDKSEEQIRKEQPPGSFENVNSMSNNKILFGNDEDGKPVLNFRDTEKQETEPENENSTKNNEHEIFVKHEQTNNKAFKTEQDIIMDNINIKETQTKSKEVQMKPMNDDTRAASGIQVQVVESKTETKYTTISNWCPLDNKSCPSCYSSSLIYARCIPFRRIIWSDCEMEHKSTGIEFTSIPLSKDDVETNSQERQEYGNSEHLNDKQTFEKGEEQIRKKQSPDSFENVDSNHNILLGYDNRKPVLNFRGTERQETKQENENSAKTNEHELFVKHEQTNDTAFKTEQDRIMDNINIKETQTKSKEVQMKPMNEDTRAASDIQVQVVESNTERKYTTISDWCPLDNKSCPSCYHSSLIYSRCIPFRRIIWSNCETEHKSTGIEFPTIPLSKDDVETNSKERQEYGNREHLNDIQTNTFDKSEEQIRKEQPPDSFENVDSNHNILLGYDNGKPVLNFRGTEKQETKQENENSAKTNEHELFVKHEQTNDKAFKTEQDRIKDNINIKETQTKSREVQMKPMNEDTRAAPDIQVQVVESKTETANANIANGKDINLKNDINHTADTKEGKVSTASAKGNEATKKDKGATPEPKHKNIKRKSPINLLNKNKQSEPKDCYDHYRKGERRDGLYKVKLQGTPKQIEVFCDMRNGGWTVIQRRQDGTISFFQDWNVYKNGFGGLYGEHWLGNDNIHMLTNQDYYRLRVDLMDWEKNKKYAEFEHFLVESEDEGYRLHVDGYTGNAGDGLSKHHSNKFSTKDVDNDKVVKEFGGSCANRFHGAGWYFKCYSSNLNGRFYKGGKIPEKRFDGITWKSWTGPNYSLKKVEMKILPVSVNKS